MAAGPILVLNSGSSSLKTAVFPSQAGDQPLLTASASGIGLPEGGRLRVFDQGGQLLSEDEHSCANPAEALGEIAAVLRRHGQEPGSVAHRVVHGGMHLVQHQRITPEVLRHLEEAVHFAPLHVPGAVALIRRAEELFPDAAQFACFDTAFHQTMPEENYRLPVPEKYAEQGVRRYGFHGLSYESIVRALGREGQVPARLVVAHLGGGSSLCAIRDGRSVATTMGLTPTGGIPSATRTGDLDPGVVLYLLRAGGVTVDALETLVNQGSGLAAISGGSGDMQALEKAAAEEGAEAARAQLAIAIFADAVARTVASYAVVLGGVDLLVFTGGIGEHSESLRTAVTERLEPLRLFSGESRPRAIPAAEELVMAEHVRALSLTT